MTSKRAKTEIVNEIEILKSRIPIFDKKKDSASQEAVRAIRERITKLGQRLRDS